MCCCTVRSVCSVLPLWKKYHSIEFRLAEYNTWRYFWTACHGNLSALFQVHVLYGYDWYPYYFQSLIIWNVQHTRMFQPSWSHQGLSCQRLISSLTTQSSHIFPKLKIKNEAKSLIHAKFYLRIPSRVPCSVDFCRNNDKLGVTRFVYDWICLENRKV